MRRAAAFMVVLLTVGAQRLGAESLSDGIPDPVARPATRRMQEAARTERWRDERVASRIMPGVPRPEADFYLAGVDRHAQPDGKPRALFHVLGKETAGVAIGVGDCICEWQVTEIRSDPKYPLDGFVRLRSRDGATTSEMWQHLPLLSFGDKPWMMDFAQWEHHQTQIDAICYRASHCICVVRKPNGDPDDAHAERSGPPPAELVVPVPPPQPDPPQRLQMRGMLQEQLGRRLPADFPVAGEHFFVTGIDLSGRSAVIRFAGAPNVSVIATVGDNVCGWMIRSFRRASDDPADLAVTLQPYGMDGTVDLWQRLVIPKDGTPLAGRPVTIDLAKWQRHRFEPDAQHARAEGRLIVRDTPRTRPVGS